MCTKTVGEGFDACSAASLLFLIHNNSLPKKRSTEKFDPGVSRRKLSLYAISKKNLVQYQSVRLKTSIQNFCLIILNLNSKHVKLDLRITIKLEKKNLWRLQLDAALNIKDQRN
jgi:hypothetical protein